MMSTPPRLHVITATQSPMALILRRGPSRHVATIGWNRDTGVFELGQWLKGRIFEHRSDLSPDGRLFVYFAGKGGTRWWTAVSRAPWLTADLWLPQSDTWGGGGAFTETGELWLSNGLTDEEAAGTSIKLAKDRMAYPNSTDGFHMGDTYAAMMAKRGWHHVSGIRYETVLQKPVNDGWHLQLWFDIGAKDRSIIANRYGLVNTLTGQSEVFPDWEWADVYGDVLQIAKRGAVYEATLDADGILSDQKLLKDFSDMTFEERLAPYKPQRKK